jgi:hypothetical protein
VGAFNVQGASWSRAKGIFVERFDDAAEFVVAEVSPSDVETLRSSKYSCDALEEEARSSASTSFPPLFAVHAHRSGETRALGAKDVWRVKLRPKQWEIYAVARVRRTREETTNRDSTLKNLQWAFIGLTGMLNGGGAVLSDSHRVEREANGASSSAARGKRLTNARRVCVVAFATVYGCGSLAAFATARPRSVLVDGEPVAFRFDRDATGATGEVCGGRVLVPLGPREDTHEVQMRFEA